MQRIATDVLVIGAGPAGAAAARALALQGREVLLVDRCEFPRDKVCGDGLIPDALRALERLGLLERILAESRRLASVRVYAPNGTYVCADVDFACLPRRRLDALMRDAAIAAGATFLAPYEVAEALEEEDGSVAGARLAPAGARSMPDTCLTRAGGCGEGLTVRASHTILATGAAVAPLERFSVCRRRSASAVAARFYLRAPHDLALQTQHFAISYDRHIAPGYGWIFPGPDRVFNIGVGYFDDARRPRPDSNLRTMLARFVATFPPAREILAVSERLTDIRGAPLRTSLGGSALSRPGLLVVGDACGATYPLTGEGIGKAIETGMIAAEILGDARGAAHAARARAAALYAAAVVARLKPRFQAYKAAQRWLRYPAVHDFLAWRGRSGRFVVEQLQDLLRDTGDPAALLSVGGMLKALTA
ncbi:MAG: NAD(P)/FAD-dependent oxidoreductase [Rudaea sp.]